MSCALATGVTLLLISGAVGGAEPPAGVEHVDVYRKPGRFGGWPANHGIWSWGQEIFVGFSAGYCKDLRPYRNHIDHERTGRLSTPYKATNRGWVRTR